MNIKLKGLETLVGQKIEFPDEITTRWTVSTYETTSGYVTSKEFRHTGEQRIFCYETPMLQVNGTVSTNHDGEAKMTLSDHICSFVQGPASRILYHGPLNFLVTPSSLQPSMFSAMARIIENGNDIEMSINSWDKNNKPLPHISFYWQLKSRYSEEIS